MNKIVFILALIALKTNIVYSQELCNVLGFPTSTVYARAYLETVKEKYKDDEYVKTSLVDTFQVVDICRMKNIYLIELEPQQKKDTLGSKTTEIRSPTSFLIISIEEDNFNCITKMKIGDYYKLKIDPYFPVDRAPGDFMYPVLLGKSKKEAIEVQFVIFANIYTSSQINGVYYCSQ